MQVARGWGVAVLCLLVWGCAPVRVTDYADFEPRLEMQEVFRGVFKLILTHDSLAGMSVSSFKRTGFVLTRPRLIGILRTA